MNLRAVFDEFRRNAAAFGWRSAVGALTLGAIKRVFGVRVLRAMYVTAVAPTFAAAAADVSADFFDRETLRRMTADARYDLTSDFLDEALAKGDECYGIVDGTRPAAYGWYAHTPTKLSDDLRLSFDPKYVYMYKGLTLEAYRGRRLHAIGMTAALAAYRARGYKGLVTYVDADNLNSLKSSHRMGYVDVGRVFLMKLGGRHVILRTPGCAAFGLRVEPIPGNARPRPRPPGPKHP